MSYMCCECVHKNTVVCLRCGYEDQYEKDVLLRINKTSNQASVRSDHKTSDTPYQAFCGNEGKQDNSNNHQDALIAKQASAIYKVSRELFLTT